MTSLYRRATPSQARILRIVAGAVKNVADHHPNFPYTPRLARSIAKRAAGTLTAQWPDVLAARKTPPDLGPERFYISGPVRDREATPVGGTRSRRRRERERQSDSWRSLYKTHKEIQKAIGPLKKAGETERANGLIDALRIIHIAMNAEKIP